ncbi:MAG TPA: protein-export chaperone SecB [Candidatus Bacteroides pullicola]|uniref:Protein-export chaperone SecB n=1 Tax=Candidatus Bacteroides pullicola TaxID=2838475 RepID=A0A9D2CLM2_9BACE|nr:protein-export chaperone SecB [Candidatus Bacteroides pullicola]
METKISPFKFNGYLVKHSEINLSENIPDGEELRIDIEPSGVKRGKDFTLTLCIHLYDNGGLIDVKAEVLGYFTLKNEEANVPDFLTRNAPAILFPYVRAYVSLLTSLSGKGTINLPTLNLSGLEGELRKNMRTE